MVIEVFNGRPFKLPAERGPAGVQDIIEVLEMHRLSVQNVPGVTEGELVISRRASHFWGDIEYGFETSPVLTPWPVYPRFAIDHRSDQVAQLDMASLPREVTIALNRLSDTPRINAHVLIPNSEGAVYSSEVDPLGFITTWRPFEEESSKACPLFFPADDPDPTKDKLRDVWWVILTEQYRLPAKDLEQLRDLFEFANWARENTP